MRQDYFVPRDSATDRANLCFFFNDTATTEIYTLSLHDALPISLVYLLVLIGLNEYSYFIEQDFKEKADRKSTRLNSSHGYISYAVFCLKKKTGNPYTRGLLRSVPDPTVDADTLYQIPGQPPDLA